MSSSLQILELPVAAEFPPLMWFTQQRNSSLPELTIAKVITNFMSVHAQPTDIQAQFEATACIKCASPNCRSRIAGGCPLQNPMQTAHGLMTRGDWKTAFTHWNESNPLMEFMDACPAPCEGVCIAGVREPQPIGIRINEQALFARAVEQGWLKAPAPRYGEKNLSVGIVGSGPAGLAAAIVLRQAGATVHVFEKSDLFGGLCMEGVAPFHLEKSKVLDRIELMRSGGIHFHNSTNLGSEENPVNAKADGVSICVNKSGDQWVDCDYLIVAVGAKIPKDPFANYPGRRLNGIYHAMDFLVPICRREAGQADSVMDLNGHSVGVIGGGLTALDVRGSSIRMDRPVVELIRKPIPDPRPDWTTEPLDLEAVTAFGEGGEVKWGTRPTEFLDREGSGWITHVKTENILNEPPVEIPVTRLFLALGFHGPGNDSNSLPHQLGLSFGNNGMICVDPDFRTSHPRIFAVGDCVDQPDSPHKLIVTATQHGRDAANVIKAEQGLL